MTITCSVPAGDPPASGRVLQNAENAHLTGVPHDLDADTFYGAPADLQKYVIG